MLYNNQQLSDIPGGRKGKRSFALAKKKKKKKKKIFSNKNLNKNTHYFNEKMYQRRATMMKKLPK